MVQLVEGPVAHMDEGSDGAERPSLSLCGFTMFLDRGGIPLEPTVAAYWLTITLYGLPCHDDPLLYSAGSDERWRNAVGELEPSTRGRAPIDAWPSWYIDMVLLDVL